MTGAHERDREDAFRTDVARVVQAMRHHLPTRNPLPEIAPLLQPARHLASLLDRGAPTEHLRQAACTLVNVYEWPTPEAASGDEGPVIDPAILAAVERLRAAIDLMDEAEEGP